MPKRLTILPDFTYCIGRVFNVNVRLLFLNQRDCNFRNGSALKLQSRTPSFRPVYLPKDGSGNLDAYKIVINSIKISRLLAAG